MVNLRKRKLNRWGDWDYKQPGWYFVTICVKRRWRCLGDVLDGKMVLNQIGGLVEKQWLWLGQQYPYIQLDKWVIMPNHVHGIVRIMDRMVVTGLDLSLQGEHKRDLSLREKNKNQHSLSQIVGAFKTTSSKLIHEFGVKEFAWQRSFYDHIIRSEEALEKIRWYVANNPKMWDRDRNNI